MPQAGCNTSCRLTAYLERQLTGSPGPPRYDQIFRHVYVCQQPRCLELKLALGLLLVDSYNNGLSAVALR